MPTTIATPQKVVVLCTSASGDPVFHTSEPLVTTTDVVDGKHYELAKKDAALHGFEGPMMAFDSLDAAADQLGDIAVWLSAP